MNNDVSLKRRHFLQLGGIGGLGLLAAGTGSALADEVQAATGLHIEDLGPGIQTFTMMSSVMVGDTIYMSTRNVEPMKVVAYDLVSRTVTSVTDVFGESAQAMAVEPSGRYLYGCVRIDGGQDSRLFRIDLNAPGRPMETLPDVQGLIPFTMAIAPDGVVFFGGRESAPKLRQYDPATGSVSILATPDTAAQYGRSLLATNDAVYFGLRATNPTSGAAAAGFYSIDRTTGVATSILPPRACGNHRNSRYHFG